ncbi:hypothetical protein SCHPADRAFT_80179 [Schizopora paradoxa]|uniref:Uncharacterized protein n=1 Tax=Schizopora paradoxa TaxID=27342 RepID=A0A0H2S4R9_9AGAM|nr:hypothetical protein SCHPADRAFT_80179 [Schizopora paradoxa]
MTSRARKSAAPVRFAEDLEEDFAATQDGGEDNMMDMLSIMQEYQKMKAAKASTKSNALQAKKNTIVSNARKEAQELVQDGNTFFDSLRRSVEEMQSQELLSDGILKEVVALWSAHEDEMDTLLAIFPTLIDELSPRRTQEINDASEMLETHPRARDASRRRMMKSAKRNLEAGLEAQKLATDASALMKHYKALLSS